MRHFLFIIAGLLTTGSLLAADPINAKCPVLPDEDVDPAFTVTWKGQVVGLCCARCVRQFTADPEKYAARLPTPPPATHGTDHPQEPAVAATAASHGEAGHDPAPAQEGNPASGHHHGESATSAPKIPRFLAWFGRFHPVIVHFPIALTILGSLAAVIAHIRSNEAFRQTARIAMHGAAISAVPAILFGWLAAAAGPHPGLDAVLAWHRWLGTATGAAVIAIAVLLELAHRRPDAPRWLGLGVLGGSVVLALAIGIVGHLGGILVYGPEHFAL